MCLETLGLLCSSRERKSMWRLTCFLYLSVLLHADGDETEQVSNLLTLLKVR